MNALTGPHRHSSAADAEATVVGNRAVADSYHLLTIDAGAAALAARAGQFFQLACPVAGPDRPYFRRPLSLYAIDVATGTVSFLYKVTGAGTRALTTLVPGDRLNVLGPLGVGFSVPAEAKAIVLLGRGVGIATLAQLAETARLSGRTVTALLSARSAEHLLAAKRLRAVGATVVPLLDSDGSSAVPFVEAELDRLAEAGLVDALYTCGSSRLLALAQRVGRRHGLFGEVALESHMACGLGMCFACVREFETADGGRVTKRVCWDGPVFPLLEAVP